MESLFAAILLVATLPVVLYNTWTDLKFMRITNKSNIALLLIFVVIAPFFITWSQYGLQLLQFAVMLIIGFGMTSAGLMGGGDSKLFAAIAPYILLQDLLLFVVILLGLSIIAVLIHRIIGWIEPLLNLVKDWKSWEKSAKFPYGWPLSVALTVYLCRYVVV